MASQIASLEEDRTAYQEQLSIVEAQLKEDPDNAELQSLQAELGEMIALLDESIADLRPKNQPSRQQAPPPPAQTSPPPPAAPEKRQPGFKKATTSAPAPTPSDASPADDEPSVVYRVNDEVQARWLSGDKAFYPARITSVTGSSTAPIYLVRFKSYKGTETLRAKDIRPASNKRKAEGPPADSPATTAYNSASATPPGGASTPGGFAPPAPPGSGIVMSAAASRYPEAQLRAEGDAAGQGGKPPRAKKIKANKELEAGKNKWQEFSAKSRASKKSYKKDSMFRTPEGVHGRVGFTGSGQAMRKDPTRSRHIYQTNDDVD